MFTKRSAIVPSAMITRIDMTATLVSNSIVANIYSIGPNTEEALLMKPKKEKNAIIKIYD